MLWLSSILFVLLLIALIVGLIKPSLVIRWGAKEERNRKQVIGLFFVSFVALTVIGTITSLYIPQNSNTETNEHIGAGAINHKNQSDIIPYNENKPIKHTNFGVAPIIDSYGNEIHQKDLMTITYTKAYNDLDAPNNHQKMKEEEIEEILGKKKANEIWLNHEGETCDEIAVIAMDQGFELEKQQGPFCHWEMRSNIEGVNQEKPKDIKWKVIIRSSQKDIRKENSDAVVEKMCKTIQQIIKEMPDHTVLDLHINNKKPYIDQQSDGDLSCVNVTYYRDLNAFTKLVITHRKNNGEEGYDAIYDVVQ